MKEIIRIKKPLYERREFFSYKETLKKVLKKLGVITKFHTLYRINYTEEEEPYIMASYNSEKRELLFVLYQNQIKIYDEKHITKYMFNHIFIDQIRK